MADGLAAAPAPAVSAEAKVPEPSPPPAAPELPASLAPAESHAEQEAAAAPAEAAQVQPERSMLGELREKPEPKPEPKAEAKPEPKAEAAPTPAEPVVWEYTVPETVKLDDDGRKRVNGILEAFVANPRDKANQQALVDYHVEQMAALAQQTADFNRNFWSETRKAWRERIKSDEQLGGSGFKTTQAAIKRMMDLLVKPEHEAEWEEFIEVSGAGDHPALHRLLHNAARFFDEPRRSAPNPQPPADIGRPPGRGRLRDRYTSM